MVSKTYYAHGTAIVNNTFTGIVHTFYLNLIYCLHIIQKISSSAFIARDLCDITLTENITWLLFNILPWSTYLISLEINQSVMKSISHEINQSINQSILDHEINQS